MEKPYYIIAPTAFAIYFTFVCLSALSDPSWNMFRNNLSDLGEGSGVKALFFNIGCAISGAMLCIYGAIMRRERDLRHTAGALFIGGGVGLFLLAFATGDYEPAHSIAAGILLFGVGFAITIATWNDIKGGNTVVRNSTLVLLVFVIVQWPFLEGAVSEMMPILTASVWSVVQMHEHIHDIL